MEKRSKLFHILPQSVVFWGKKNHFNYRPADTDAHWKEHDSAKQASFYGCFNPLLCISTTRRHPFWSSSQFIFLHDHEGSIFPWHRRCMKKRMLRQKIFKSVVILFWDMDARGSLFSASLLFNPTWASTNYADFVQTWCFSYTFFTIQSNASLNY